MKLKEIQNLIKFVAKSGASEVSLEMEDVKITVKTNHEPRQVLVQEPVVVPQAQPPVTPPPVIQVDAPIESSPEEDSNLITIK